ncbi:MAG: ABC-F family ATP-binding cassette domain-containing protein, partial [Spirochaetota bacterium]|nr:ABC-F family ATP-binding cassette domain-containing protein [Spirochaetota bacterium]
NLIHKDVNDADLQEKYGQLLHKFENDGGYTIEHRVEKVLTGLGFNEGEWHRKISTFSGGERRRGLLAKLLLSEAKLLLLDEPTNHLDIFSIKWLEGFLKDYNTTIIMVSHDRHFLDSLVTEILELDGTISKFSGNYKYYLQEKETRIEAQFKAYELQKQKVEKEEEFIRKNIAGQKTKLAQSRRKALEKLDLVQPPKKEKNFKIQLSHDVSKQKIIAEINKYSKYFENRVIIDSLSLKIEKGDKIGLIGKNGCGKSTLIKSLIFENKTDKSININPNIKIAYFAQSNDELDDSITIYDTIYNKNPNLKEQEIRNYLALFQFKGDDIFKFVKQLSGGERTRVSLLCKILFPSDFLVLDEPTNHLDIQTISALGDALNQFPGTVLVVSHDRDFLDRFINKVLFIDKGKTYYYLGNYNENEDKLSQTIKNQLIPTNSTPEKPKEKKKNVNMYKLEKIESQIAILENKKEKLVIKMQDEKVYSNYEEYLSVENELKNIDTQLTDLYSEWESIH